jgi:PEP-CTERM motif
MNKNLKNWLRISAVALPLAVISVAASAGMIGVGFDTTGSANWGPSCGTSCTELNLAGTTTVSGLNGYFGSAAPNLSFSALLDVTPDSFGSSAVGTAPTGGWQLQDGSGDSLYGWVNGWLSGTPGNSAGVGLLDFGITGGTGLFGDVSGSGGALADFSWNGSFNDAGLLLLDSSSAPASNVPEPGTLALFAAALAALGWTFARRRTTFRPRRASANL